MAASAAAFAIEVNVYCFLNAFAQATTTFVSQNYGAGNLPRCFAITKVGLLLDIACTLCMATIVIVFAREFLAIFNADETVVELGIIRFWYIVAPQFLQVFIDVLSGALRGYGFSLPPALLALVGICGVRITWLYTLFPASPTYGTLMACYPVSWLITGIFIGILYRYCRGHIKLIRV
jgi:Na+-driven multidrug efflux pump